MNTMLFKASNLLFKFFDKPRNSVNSLIRDKHAYNFGYKRSNEGRNANHALPDCNSNVGLVCTCICRKRRPVLFIHFPFPSEQLVNGKMIPEQAPAPPGSTITGRAGEWSRPPRDRRIAWRFCLVRE